MIIEREAAADWPERGAMCLQPLARSSDTEPLNAWYESAHDLRQQNPLSDLRCWFVDSLQALAMINGEQFNT